MRQEDLDMLTKRISRMLRDMLPPGADYRVVMIVAERQVDGINLSLGTTADVGTATALCEMAMSEYATQASEASSAETDRLVEAVHRLIETLLDRNVVKDGEPPPGSVTKH